MINKYLFMYILYTSNLNFLNDDKYITKLEHYILNKNYRDLEFFGIQLFENQEYSKLIELKKNNIDMSICVKNSIFNVFYYKYLYFKKNNNINFTKLQNLLGFNDLDFGLCFKDKDIRNLYVLNVFGILYADSIIYIYKEAHYSSKISQNKSIKLSIFLKEFKYCIKSYQPLLNLNKNIIDRVNFDLKDLNLSNTEIIFLFTAEPNKIFNFNLHDLKYRNNQIESLVKLRFSSIDSSKLLFKLSKLLKVLSIQPNKKNLKTHIEREKKLFNLILDKTFVFEIDQNDNDLIDVKNNSLRKKIYISKENIKFINQLNTKVTTYIEAISDSDYYLVIFSEKFSLYTEVDKTSNMYLEKEFLFLNSNKYLKSLISIFINFELYQKNILIYLSDKEHSTEKTYISWSIKYKNYILIKNSFFLKFSILGDFFFNLERDFYLNLTDSSVQLTHILFLYKKVKFFIKQNKESKDETKIINNLEINKLLLNLDKLNITVCNHQLNYLKQELFNNYLSINFDRFWDLNNEIKSIYNLLDNNQIFLLKNRFLLEPFSITKEYNDINQNLDYDVNIVEFKNTLSNNLSSLIYLINYYLKINNDIITNKELFAINKLQLQSRFTVNLGAKHTDILYINNNEDLYNNNCEFENNQLILNNFNLKWNSYLTNKSGIYNHSKEEFLNLLDLITEFYYLNATTINSIKSLLMYISYVSKDINRVLIESNLRNNLSSIDLNNKIINLNNNILKLDKLDLSHQDTKISLYNNIVATYLNLFYIKQTKSIFFKSNTNLILISENIFISDIENILNIYQTINLDLNLYIKLIEKLNIYIQKTLVISYLLENINILKFNSENSFLNFNYFLCFRGRVYTQESKFDWINHKLFRYIYFIDNKENTQVKILKLKNNYTYLVNFRDNLNQEYSIFNYNYVYLLEICYFFLKKNKLIEYKLGLKLSAFYLKFNNLVLDKLLECKIINNYTQEIIFLDSFFWIFCNLGYIKADKHTKKTYNYKVLLDLGINFFETDLFNCDINTFNFSVEETLQLNFYLQFFKENTYFDLNSILNSKLSIPLDSSCNGYTQLINIFSNLSPNIIEDYKKNLNLVYLSNSRDFYQFITNKIKLDFFKKLEELIINPDNSININKDLLNSTHSELITKIKDFSIKNSDYIFNRRVFKKILMTLPYGATRFTFWSLLEQQLSDIITPDFTKPLKKKMFDLILNSVLDIFSSKELNSDSIINYKLIKFIMNYIKQSEAELKSIHLKFDDLAVNLSYNLIEGKRYNLKFNSIDINNTSYTNYQITDKLNIGKIEQALIANCAHAYDSIIMREMIRSDNISFLNIHDCFKVNIFNASFLLRFYSKTFIKIHNKYNLLDTLIFTLKDNSSISLRNILYTYDNSYLLEIENKSINNNLLTDINDANYILKL